MNATHQLLTKLAFWYCQSSEPVRMYGNPTFDEAYTYAKEIVNGMDDLLITNSVAVFDFWDWTDRMFDEVLYIIASTRKAEVEKARKLLHRHGMLAWQQKESQCEAAKNG